MVVYYDEAQGKWIGTKVDDYRAGVAELKRLDNPAYQLWSRKEVEPLENCLQIVKTGLTNTLKVLKANEYRLFLSGRKNFRDDIYPDYKSNRDGAARPKYFRDIRDYLVAEWSGRICDGIEADDAVGIYAMELKGNGIIVAQDKDLDQIPGRHYNWTTGEAYDVSVRGGLGFFYEQMLSGDPTDNIPGIEGIGPVKARKALSDVESPKEAARRVWRMYYDNREAFGFHDDEDQRKFLDRNAHLLWIQRKKDDKHPFWKHLES